MRVLDKILYKAKLQVGGKVIKTDKGYVENPDGILNSATIDDNKYTGIDKAKIISDKFNGQDVSTYRYKDVDYLLDYKPKGLNNIDYGISDKTYTKSVTPVSTTNTNSASTTISERSNPKFMPNDNFSTDMSKSTNTPPVLSTSTKPNGLNRGLFTTTEKANKLGIKPKPAPIIPSVIGNTTSQQSTSNTAVQPASITTTEPEKRKGLINRIFGRKDNKVTSDNPTPSSSTDATPTDVNNTSSSEPKLPAKYSETTTSTTTTPTLATSSNNSVSTATTSAFDPNKVSNYKLDDMGAILDENGNKIPFSSFQEENAAKELFWSTNKNVKEIPNTSNPVVTTTESSNQNPTQQATTNNAVVTEDGYSINEDGILLQGGKPTSLSPEKNDAARARVIAKQKDLQSTQTSNIASQTNNVPTGQTTIPKANVGNNNTSSATSANRNPNVNPTSQLPITTTQTSVSDNANQIPTIGDVPTIKTNTGVNTTINQEAELSESAKNNNRYVYDDYNNVIYRPDGSKAELTSRQKRDLFYYRDNSDLPLNANKERAARIHGEQGFYKTLVGSNEKEGKAIAEKPTTDVVTDALYNGKDWNKDIYSFESKSGVVITPDGTRVTLPPDIAKDVRKSIGMYNNSGSPNEKGIQNAIRQGVEKVTNSSSPTSSTNKPTPVTEIKLPANLETPTSSQPKPVPVLGTDTPIKPVVGFPAQQPANVQPGVSTQSSQNINTPAKNKDVAKSRNISGKLAIPDVTQEETATLRDQHRILNNDPENSPRIMSSQTPNEIYNDYSVPGHYRVQNVISKIGESPLINDMKVWDETQKMLVFFRDLPIAVQKRYIESAKTNITNNNNSTANYEPLNRNNPNPKESVYNKDYYTMENFNAMNADNYKGQTANAAALIGKEDRDAFYNKSTKDRGNVLQKEADIVAMYEYAVPAPGYERDKGLGFYNLDSQTDPVSHYKIDPKKVPKGYNIDIEKVYTNAEIAAALAYHRSLREAYVHLHRDLPQRPTIFKNETKRRKEETEGTIKRQEREKVQDRKLIAKIRHIAEVAPEENRLSEEQEKEFNENYDKKLKEDEKRKKEYRKKQGLKNQSGGYINKTKYRFI